MGSFEVLSPPAGYLAMFNRAASENKRLLANKELGEQLRQGGLLGHFWARQMVLVSHCNGLRRSHDYVDPKTNFLLRAQPLLDANADSGNCIFNGGGGKLVVLMIDPLSFEPDLHRGTLMQVVHPAAITLVNSPVAMGGHNGQPDSQGYPTIVHHLFTIPNGERITVYLREGISPIMRGEGVMGFTWNMMNLQYSPAREALALACPI
jgi:hypothetical protein